MDIKNKIKKSLGDDICEWKSNTKKDSFAGAVCAFAVIPEVIGFTIVAGVDPILGLYTSIAFLLLMSLLGGRSAMVSAGAGSMAVVVAPLISGYGLDYMVTAVLIAGVIQIVLGLARVGRMMRRIPTPIVTGFVDGLAIIIFLSQITSITKNIGSTAESMALMFGLIIVGLVVILLFPKVSKAVPSTLVAILVVTVITALIGMLINTNDVVMISDLGNLNAYWPDFNIPALLTNIDALSVIFPYALSLAFVGLLETMLTSQVVDKVTGTECNSDRECCAQGVTNIVCGTMGTMPGCAMIGQTVTNVESGGRGRLSTFLAGVILMLLLAFGSSILGIIPLAALIAVMIYVSAITFDWRSFKRMFQVRDRWTVCESVMTVVTVITVVISNNLAYGVVTGMATYILLWSIFGDRKVPIFKSKNVN